jgi:RimJ/RimL family protein N-acetyltransferase
MAAEPAGIGAPPLRLVVPGPQHLASYTAALKRGWSADNVRGAAAAAEELQRIGDDPAAFLALMDDPQGLGPPVTLADGSTRPRIPSLRRWMWEWADDAGHDSNGAPASDAAGGFCGSISLRWMPGGAPLPPHVLGHIGYAVVPWKRRRGHATRALALVLELARRQGLAEVQVTTDADNGPSQRVVLANGGRLVGPFDLDAAHGGGQGLRFAITL